MVGKVLRFGVLLVVGMLALVVSGCGSKKKAAAEDPVATAMQTPGVRTVVIPKQRNAVTVVVTPCSAAAVQQSGAKRKPPGSNEIVVLDLEARRSRSVQGIKELVFETPPAEQKDDSARN